MFSRVIELEVGTMTAAARPQRVHNGYWAGDFESGSSDQVLRAWFAWGRAAATTTR